MVTSFSWAVYENIWSEGVSGLLSVSSGKRAHQRPDHRAEVSPHNHRPEGREDQGS